MESNKEYEGLISRRDNARGQYNASMRRIEDYNYMIRRLKNVKTMISDEKKAFKTLKKADEEILDAKRNWEGQTKTDFLTKGDAMTSENNYYYKNSLDRILDALNDEITRLENKRNREYGILGDLASLINSLANEIENFFN